MKNFVDRIPKTKCAPRSKATKIEVPSKAKTSTHLQMYIDLGQKSFGSTLKCPTCEMLYVIGDPKDEKQHASFCASIKRGISFNPPKSLKKLAEFGEFGTASVSGGGAYDFIINLPLTKLTSTAALAPLLTQITSDLGGSVEFMCEGGGASKCYLYLTSRVCVVGCVIVEWVRGLLSYLPDHMHQ